MSIYIPTANVDRDVRDAFMRGLAAAEPQSYLPLIASVVESDGASEVYGWLGEFSDLADITGKDKIEYDGITSATYTIENKTYARGLKVHKNTWSDMRNGTLDLRIQSFARLIPKHRNKQLIDALIAGTSTACYDGIAFFSASHTARKDEGSTQSNIVTGTGTTTATVKADIWSALSRMRSFVDEGGMLINDMINDVVIVHPVGAAISAALQEAVNAQIISSTTNVGYNARITLLASGYLSDANDWYMLNTSDVLRPLIFQEREPLRLEADPNRFPAFDDGHYHWKIEGRHRVGYGRWQNAVKVTNT